jgi:hypothetical protein
MKQKTLFSLLFIITIVLFSPSLANAEGQSLSIFPPVINIDATPPSSPTIPIVIQNDQEEDVNLKIELIPFKTNDRNGDITFLPDQINKGFYPYYRDRIQFLVDDKKTDYISLKPLESKEVTLNVNLTKGDPPGDFYYTVVFLSGSTGPTDTSISRIPAGIGTNLILTVGPKEKTSGGISEFTTSSFKKSGPVEFNLKLHNASKHVILPTGTIELKNMFGKNIGVVNILPQYVIAGSDRYLLDDKSQPTSAEETPKVVWREKFLLGFYTAKASIQLDENSQPITATTYFFAFPLMLFIPLSVALFIAISIYLRVRRKLYECI